MSWNPCIRAPAREAAERGRHGTCDRYLQCLPWSAPADDILRAALAAIQPAFTDAERIALAGFLAGYRGLTREAYALDLRQFISWCRSRSLTLFAVRRADIETLRPRRGSHGPGGWTGTPPGGSSHSAG